VQYGSVGEGQQMSPAGQAAPLHTTPPLPELAPEALPELGAPEEFPVPGAPEVGAPEEVPALAVPEELPALDVPELPVPDELPELELSRPASSAPNSNEPLLQPLAATSAPKRIVPADRADVMRFMK
jgi:hypothetical protein